MRKLIVTLTILAMVGLTLPTAAHTPQQQADWHDAWIERVMQADYLTIDLMAERAAFRQSHPIRKTLPDLEFIFQESSGGNPLESGVARWLSLVETHFSPANVPTMMCLMGYESGGVPSAKNPDSSARGLFQIMAYYWASTFGISYEDLYDPVINVSIARRVFDIQGYGAWAPYNRGLCHGL